MKPIPTSAIFTRVLGVRDWYIVLLTGAEAHFGNNDIRPEIEISSSGLIWHQIKFPAARGANVWSLKMRYYQ